MPSSACTTVSGVWTVSSDTSALSWWGERCWTKTMATCFASLQARRIWENASRPPAEAPTPTTVSAPLIRTRRDHSGRAAQRDAMSWPWRAPGVGRHGPSRRGAAALGPSSSSSSSPWVPAWTARQSTAPGPSADRAWDPEPRDRAGRRAAAGCAAPAGGNRGCPRRSPRATFAMPASRARLDIRCRSSACCSSTRTADHSACSTASPCSASRLSGRVLVADVAGVADDAVLARSPTARRRTRDR